jgi:hypothetical protein
MHCASRTGWAIDPFDGRSAATIVSMHVNPTGQGSLEIKMSKSAFCEKNDCDKAE